MELSAATCLTECGPSASPPRPAAVATPGVLVRMVAAVLVLRASVHRALPL